MAAAETLPYELAGKRVWVTGHGGMVGSALLRRLDTEDCEVLTASHDELDLRRQADVEAWMNEHRPRAVFLAAARVGGILANESQPASFIYDNLAIEANVIHAARSYGIEKLLFLGSACVYPGLSPQPMSEDCPLSAPLEPTNQWYSVAKIAGIKMCEAYRLQYGCDFISAMPINLFGPGDNFDLEHSHVLPALLLKIHRAKMDGRDTVEIWGSGEPLREFLYVDDLADALVFLMQHYSEDQFVNIGTGKEISIRDLAQLIAQVVDYDGNFHFDVARPDGVPRKLLDISKLSALGWTARISLADGIEATYRWLLEQGSELRGIANVTGGGNQ